MTTYRDVACTLCGCVCDDLEFEVHDNQIVDSRGVCSLAEPWFQALQNQAPHEARIDGQPASWREAAEAAGEILSGSQSPLIYGLARSSTAGQRAAVRLADQLGAVIDTSASRCHAPSIMALQQVGESTCSLGEVANRCDLIIYWGSNPQESHPRHWERYAVEPSGMFVPGGRDDRYVVVVDVEPTATSDMADQFLQVKPGSDFDVLWALRCLVQTPTIALPETPAGEADELRGLAQRMMECRSGIIFFGLGVTQASSGHASVEALLRLVTDLNRHTRFYARRMRVPGDVAGADSVLCWQTGFPFSVNLNRGYPRYNPGEYSACEILERREADACLIVGSESVERLTPAALEGLAAIPTIVLDYPHVPHLASADIGIRTAIYGVHARGTAYRMDETPIPLTKFLDSPLPTDADVIHAVAEQIRAAVRDTAK